MPDKPDDEILDDPSIHNEEMDQSNEIIDKEEENNTLIQENKEMEVHHHAHHEGKKNWKSYFWEFLMLFLAVTLGFFVENQREHYIEHLRAKEFSKSLIRLQHTSRDIESLRLFQVHN